jgi:hypothetical protein
MNRMIGGSLGIAIIGAVFQAEAPAGARDPVAFVHAFSSAMWVATAVAFSGAIAAVVLLRGKADRKPDLPVTEARAFATPESEVAADLVGAR